MITILKPRLRDMLDIAQDEMVMRDRIASILEMGPKSIRDNAGVLGCSPRSGASWLFVIRRDGMVEENAGIFEYGSWQLEVSKRHNATSAGERGDEKK